MGEERGMGEKERKREGWGREDTQLTVFQNSAEFNEAMK